MSSLSGAKVHIYTIRPHKTKKEMTEVLAWMAYPSQSSGKTTFYRHSVPLIKKCLILKYFSVDLSETPLILSQINGKDYNPRETKEFSSEKAQFAGNNDLKLITWLLAILIFATLIFIIIFLLCYCCCRHKFRLVLNFH